MSVMRGLRRIFLALALVAPSLPLPAAAQTTPDQLLYLLKGASTPEEHDRAMEAAYRGREVYAKRIRELEETLENTNSYLLRSGSGELVSASHKQIADLAAQINLELLIDSSNERIMHLRANAGGSSQIDLAVQIALDQTVQAVNQGLAEGREMPDSETIGKVTSETMVELIVEFDRQNRESTRKDLETLEADLERLDEIIERSEGRDQASRETSQPGDGQPTPESDVVPASGPGTYIGQVKASLLMSNTPTRWETPVYFTTNADGTGSLSLNWFVKSEYVENGGGRVSCLLGGGRVDDFAIEADGRFNATVPASFGYRDVPSSAEDPCLTIEGDRASGDYGDTIPLTVSGSIDPSSGTGRLALGWPTGPIEVSLKQQ